MTSDFTYFYGNKEEVNQYLRIPMSLFKSPAFSGLSNDARLLYGFMLERLSLAEKNGWIDEDGRLYIIYPREEMMNDLMCSKNTVTKLLVALKSVDLIERYRSCAGGPFIIYVKNFERGQ